MDKICPASIKQFCLVRLFGRDPDIQTLLLLLNVYSLHFILSNFLQMVLLLWCSVIVWCPCKELSYNSNLLIIFHKSQLSFIASQVPRRSLTRRSDETRAFFEQLSLCCLTHFTWSTFQIWLADPRSRAGMYRSCWAVLTYVGHVICCFSVIGYLSISHHVVLIWQL